MALTTLSQAQPPYPVVVGSFLKTAFTIAAIGSTPIVVNAPPGIYRFTAIVIITTLEGEMHASPGDWIIKGVQGEFYPCKPDIFEATYQKPDAASFRARPQEPGLSKEWLDELIEDTTRRFIADAKEPLSTWAIHLARVGMNFLRDALVDSLAAQEKEEK